MANQQGGIVLVEYVIFMQMQMQMIQRFCVQIFKIHMQNDDEEDWEKKKKTVQLLVGFYKSGQILGQSDFLIQLHWVCMVYIG